MKNGYYLEKRREEESKVKAIVASSIIDGTGSTPIREGVIIVNRDKIIDVGPKEDVQIPSSGPLRYHPQ